MIEKKFGVVGDPIAHSLSPFIHRFAYQFYGFNYEYESYLVKSASLASFLQQHPDLDGLSVTMPLKFEAAELSKAEDTNARITGVTNTLSLSTGEIQGFNTDVFGIASAIKEATQDRLAKVAVLGSGATARSAIQAISSSLSQAEMSVFLRNEKAKQELITRFGSLIEPNFLEIESLSGQFDLVINTIPVPLNTEALDAKYILDVNYSSGQSWSNRAHAISGLEMLIWQAVAQMRIWYFNSAPELPDEQKLVRLIRDSLVGR